LVLVKAKTQKQKPESPWLLGIARLYAQ